MSTRTSVAVNKKFVSNKLDRLLAHIKIIELSKPDYVNGVGLATMKDELQSLIDYVNIKKEMK